MGISDAERRQIENEMIFRRANEKAGDDLTALDAMHIEDDNVDLIRVEDFILHFMCECSDENCTKRIPMKLSVYEKIHGRRDMFVVLPDHQVDPIENVIEKTPTYNIVKKNNYTPEPLGGLNNTPVNNT